MAEQASTHNRRAKRLRIQDARTTARFFGESCPCGWLDACWTGILVVLEGVGEAVAMHRKISALFRVALRGASLSDGRERATRRQAGSEARQSPIGADQESIEGAQ